MSLASHDTTYKSIKMLPQDGMLVNFYHQPSLKSGFLGPLERPDYFYSTLCHPSWTCNIKLCHNSGNAGEIYSPHTQKYYMLLLLNCVKMIQCQRSPSLEKNASISTLGGAIFTRTTYISIFVSKLFLKAVTNCNGNCKHTYTSFVFQL